MADHKDSKDTRHGSHDYTPGKDDPGRTRPMQVDEARSKEEIVEQAYTHLDPTPTQAEADAGKLAALNMTPPDEGGGTSADAQKKKDEQQHQKELEAQKSGGYQTRAANPIPASSNTPKAG